MRTAEAGLAQSPRNAPIRGHHGEEPLGVDRSVRLPAGAAPEGRPRCPRSRNAGDWNEGRELGAGLLALPSPLYNARGAVVPQAREPVGEAFRRLGCSTTADLEFSCARVRAAAGGRSAPEPVVRRRLQRSIPNLHSSEWA